MPWQCASRETGRTYIHPFDNQAVMAGQGTIVSELLQQLHAPDLIVASIGGGGLISGIISAAKHLSPKTRVVGVETEKLLTEPAASCSVAALIEGRIAINPGENVVVALCGANVALEDVRRRRACI